MSSFGNSTVATQFRRETVVRGFTMERYHLCMVLLCLQDLACIVAVAALCSMQQLGSPI